MARKLTNFCMGPFVTALASLLGGFKTLKKKLKATLLDKTRINETRDTDFYVKTFAGENHGRMKT